MIKARPVAGDLALGAAFLEAIRPFVWRRGLDFAAVADIHAMKRRIDAAQGRRAGRCGRPAGAHRRPQREAGRRRHPRDRVPGADPAAGLGRPRSGAARCRRRWARCACWCAPAMCRASAAANWPPPTASCAGSSTGCRWSPTGRRMSCRSGRPSWRGSPRSWATPTPPRSPRELLRHLRPGAGALRRGVRAGAGAAGARRAPVWSWISAASTPAPEATVAALARSGLRQPGRIVAAVRGWQAGHVRALRSHRARELLAQLLPRDAGRAGPPAAAGRGVQPVRRVPGAAAGRRAAAVAVPAQPAPARPDRRGARRGAVAGRPPCQPPGGAGGAAVARKRIPIRRACCAAGCRMRGCWRTSSRSPAAPCARRISPSPSPRWRAGSTPMRPACAARRLADAALDALLPRVLADFAPRFGRVRGGAMAVVALGKAGGREMMAGSDLDLMLVYDHPNRRERKPRRAQAAGRASGSSAPRTPTSRR